MTEIVDSIEFHSDVFHAGKNFGKKIDPQRHDNCKIEIHGEFIKFFYRSRIRIFPLLSAFSWEIKASEIPALPVNEHRTEDVNKRKTAQVSTPMGHVFEGPGKGKSR